MKHQLPDEKTNKKIRNLELIAKYSILTGFGIGTIIGLLGGAEPLKDISIHLRNLFDSNTYGYQTFNSIIKPLEFLAQIESAQDLPIYVRGIAKTISTIPYSISGTYVGYLLKDYIENKSEKIYEEGKQQFLQSLK